VEFYAPWCGHCKSLKGPYAEAATALKDINVEGGLILAKVGKDLALRSLTRSLAHSTPSRSFVPLQIDATVEKEIATAHDIKGFPTLKWFIDGKFAADYSGGRTTDAIVSWIKKKTGPPATVLSTADGVEKAKAEEVAAYLYVAEESGKSYDAFMSVAQKTEDVAFFVITSADTAKSVGMDKVNQITMTRNFKLHGAESVDAFTAPEDPDAVEAFLAKFKLPAYLTFNKESSSRIFGSGVDHQIIIGAADIGSDTDVVKAIKEAASANGGKVVTVLAKFDDEESAPVMEFFGFDKESKNPQVAGFLASAGKKYVFPEGKKISADTLKEFADAVVKGEAELKLKSADVPAEPYDEDGIRTLVGKNFDEITGDSKTHTLVYIGAPWCGHCKALAPTWKKMAAMFKDDRSSINIARMDGTENEVASVEVKGFPTIVYFGKDGVAVPYSGGRDLDALVAFVEEKTGLKAGAAPADEEKHEEL